jgi:hypothetical protein
MGTDEELGAKVFEGVMPMMRSDGKIDPAILAKMNASFVELGMLDAPANLDEIVTEEFLPKDSM